MFTLHRTVLVTWGVGSQADLDSEEILDELALLKIVIRMGTREDMGRLGIKRKFIFIQVL